MACSPRAAWLTVEEIAERIRSTDSASPGQGARMVARAWVDPDYRALMLQDGNRWRRRP